MSSWLNRAWGPGKFMFVQLYLRFMHATPSIYLPTMLFYSYALLSMMLCCHTPLLCGFPCFAIISLIMPCYATICYDITPAYGLLPSCIVVTLCYPYNYAPFMQLVCLLCYYVSLMHVSPVLQLCLLLSHVAPIFGCYTTVQPMICSCCLYNSAHACHPYVMLSYLYLWMPCPLFMFLGCCLIVMFCYPLCYAIIPLYVHVSPIFSVMPFSMPSYALYHYILPHLCMTCPLFMSLPCYLVAMISYRSYYVPIYVYASICIPCCPFFAIIPLLS